MSLVATFGIPLRFVYERIQLVEHDYRADTLLEEFKVGQLKDLFEQYGTSSDDDDLLQEKAIGEPIAAINSAVAQTKNIKNDDALAQYKAGVMLMNSTKSDLQAVRSILGTSNMQYQMIADNLAKQILQCGINYYNNGCEDEDVKIDYIKNAF